VIPFYAFGRATPRFLFGLLLLLSQSTASYQISTVNIDCYRCNNWDLRRPIILETLPRSDIIAFQELSAGTPQFDDILNALPEYDHCMSEVNNWNSITATTFFKKTLGAQCVGPIAVGYSCSLIKIKSTKLYNCHLPWQPRLIGREVDKLLEILTAGDILVGDLNMGEEQNTEQWFRVRSILSGYIIDRVDVVGLVGGSLLRIREPSISAVGLGVIDKSHNIVTVTVFRDISFMPSILLLLEE